MRRIAWFALAALTASACGGRSSGPSPAAPSTSVQLQDQLFVTGLPQYPDFLIAGSYKLQAMLAKADGSPTVDCTSTAVWATDNRSVARLYTTGSDFRPETEPGPFLDVGIEGEANIAATCAGVTGRLHVRVSHFDLRGTVRGADGQPISGALVRVRRQYPDASTVVATTGADGRYSVPVRIKDSIVEFSRQGFGLSSVPLKWNSEAVMTADGSLEPTSGTIAQGSGRLCNVLSNEPGYSECQSAGVSRRDNQVNFRAPRSGPVVVRVQWPGASASAGEFVMTLRCDAQNMANYYDTDGAGVGFTFSANTSCQYSVVLVNTTTQRVLSYSYAVEIR